VEIRELIKELGRAKTVIFSTHILPEVEATCDRILIIDKGRIVADGGPAELRNKARGQDVVRITIEEGDHRTQLEALGALAGVEEALPDAGPNAFLLRSGTGLSVEREVFQLCVQRGWVLTGMHRVETRLEDVFRELTLD
jgi:ABC-2 type transport system ATP-binding protein